MGNTRLDFVVVGHNELSAKTKAAQIVTQPAAVRRQSARTLINLDGSYYSYLNALNKIVGEEAPAESAPYYCAFEPPNLACMYLTSFLRKRGFGGEVVNCFWPELERFDELLREGRPRVLAITTTLYFGPDNVREIAERAKQLSPETVVIVGGPYVWNLANYIRNPKQFDAVLKTHGADLFVKESQGELTLARILENLRAGEAIDSIPNIYRKDPDTGRFHFTGLEAEANGMDQCAEDWSLFTKAELGKIVSMRTARSCAFACSFCEYPIRAGELSLKSIDTVEREIRQLVDQGVEMISFIDDTFNIPKRRFIDMCKMMIRNDFGIEWVSYFRAANAKEDEIFDLAKESGCQAVFLGIESGDAATLERMNKKADVSRYESGIKRLHERGIQTYGSFIIGFPGETQESVENTISFIERSNFDYYRAEPWFSSEAQPVYKQAVEEHGLTGQAYSWEHNTMTSDEAITLCDDIYKNIRTSISLPDSDFGFWSIPYLISKGMSKTEVADFLRCAQSLVELNLTPDLPDWELERDTRKNALVDQVRGCSLQPARYTKKDLELSLNLPNLLDFSPTPRTRRPTKSAEPTKSVEPKVTRRLLTTVK